MALLLTNIACGAGQVGPNGIEGEARDRFVDLGEQDWQEVFFDTGTEDWQKQWFLNGQKAEVSNSEKGMNFRAGPIPKTWGQSSRATLTPVFQTASCQYAISLHKCNNISKISYYKCYNSLDGNCGNQTA